MATVYVNDKPVDIGDARLNAVEAAARAGVHIPIYCWHPALTVVASCRMCLIECGDKKPDGSVAMQNRVVPACQTPVKDGTVIITNSEKAKYSQAQSLENLLLNHPLDCPVCDKAGECTLQDFSFRYGWAQSRMIDDKLTPPNKPHIGDNVTLFTDRCIKCSRCVRFTREISGEGELAFVSRGEHEEIDTFPGVPLNNKLATNVVDLCPVGALCSKDFLYKHRVWNLKTVDSVCPDCSTGCSIHLDGNKNIVYRLRPRENPKAQGWFMCDDGRLGYPYINSPTRITRPQMNRDGKGAKPVSWSEIIKAMKQDLSAAAKPDGSGLVGVFSPFLTCEEACLLAKYLKGLSGQVRLALGPVPIVGDDDTYPKDVRGKSTSTVKFTIRAEKCPNRRGVEEILRHFQGDVIAFQDVVNSVNAGQVQAIYLAAGYPPRESAWITAEQAEALKKVKLLIVQDLAPSPISAVAHYLIPAASFAEKDGTFVNHAGLAQAIHRGVASPGECHTDGQVFLDLLGRRGLVHAPTLRSELAHEVPFFATLRDGNIAEHGVNV